MCSKKIDMYVDGHGNYLFYNVFFRYVQSVLFYICVCHTEAPHSRFMLGPMQDVASDAPFSHALMAALKPWRCQGQGANPKEVIHFLCSP